MHRFLNCVYVWCLGQVGPEGRARFDEELAAPLAGAEKATPTQAQVEVEGEAFMAAMQMHQQRKGA
jgi:hypothetical protein